MTNRPAATGEPLEHVTLRHIDDLQPDPNNARTHSPEQVAQIAASMREFGFTNPLMVDDVIRAGNGRYAALRMMQAEGDWPSLPNGSRLPDGMVPVVDCSGWDDARRRAYALADNKLALNAGWDEDRLRQEMADLAAMDFTVDVIGFDAAELEKLLNPEAEPDPKTPGALTDRFGAPPFTILDTRQGYWTQRRDEWLQRTGNLSATKEGVLTSPSGILHAINEASSNFDPVLAELMMRWFCPAGGKVLDPFGGEQTKGVVAGTLGLHYRAVEFRQDQVELDQAACARFGDAVQYHHGDSEDIASIITERGFDLCFTSPPYYDLEVYSADDMSALGTYAEFMAKYERIFAACIEMLADDSWLVVKIGEIRDKATGIYRGFVPDNIAMFQRLGLAFYNEAILINAAGTAPQRANRSMQNRKLVKLHQNVLCFCKGDPERAAKRIGPVVACDFGEEGDEA